MGGSESSDATLAHCHHPRGPILTLRPTVQGWEGTDYLIGGWAAERGNTAETGGSGVEVLTAKCTDLPVPGVHVL
eukprot:159196-Prorocentrum_minimum.AAC.1